MKLKSLRCPNCGGPVKKIGEKNYVCESCGTSFVPDLDPEDVEMERIKAEAEIKKKRIDAVQNGMNRISNAQRSQGTRAAKSIALIMVSMIVVIIMISVFVTIFSATRYMHHRNQYANTSDYDAKRSELEEKAKKLQEEAQKAQEETARRMQEALSKPKYVTSLEEILADETFTTNAKAALRAATKNTDFLVWSNYFIDGEPMIMRSYLLVAKDEKTRPQNRLISIYRINWYAEYDADDEEEYHRDYFPLYQAQELTDLTINSDGTIKSDYVPDNVSWHTEIPRNQMFWGYADYDQLIRECILAQSDYAAIEIDFSDGLGEEADTESDSGEDDGQDNDGETE